MRTEELLAPYISRASRKARYNLLRGRDKDVTAMDLSSVAAHEANLLMNRFCSYGPACKIPVDVSTLVVCQRCKMRHLHHICQGEFEAHYKDVFDLAPMGKFCRPCLVQDAEERGEAVPRYALSGAGDAPPAYLPAAPRQAGSTGMMDATPPSQAQSAVLLNSIHSSLPSTVEECDEATSPGLGKRQGASKRGRPTGNKNRPATDHLPGKQQRTGDIKNIIDPENMAKGSPFTADELQLLLSLRLNPQTVADFRSKKISNIQLWKMLSIQYNKTYAPDRTRNAEALKTKYSLLHSVYRNYVDKVRQYKQ